MGRKKAAISGQVADVDLRLLRVFRAVVEAGGLSAAEIQLNLANSTISNYIGDLEKRLDMRLCERGRAGFSLTQQGRDTYDATLELLSAIDQFRHRVNRSHHHISGHLHLGFAEHMLGAPNACIINALSLFSNEAPDVRVRITTMSSDDIATAIQEKQVDIGITVLPQPFSEFETLPLFEEQMHLYCGQTHPLFSAHEHTLNEACLAQYKFVESPRLMPGREAFAETRTWNKHAKAHHQEARATLILSGHYLGFLPQHLVKNWGMEHEMRALLPNQYSYCNHFSAVWRKKHSNEQIINAFTQHLHKALASD